MTSPYRIVTSLARTRLGILALALLSVVAFPGRGAAQTCSATAPSGAPTCNTTLNAQATVAHLLQLTVTGGAQTTLASPVATSYDSSAAAASADEYPGAVTGPVLTVKANRGWQLTIKAQNAYFTFTTDATYAKCRPGDSTTPTCSNSSNAANGKASDDLVWSLNATTAFAGLTTSAAAVASNTTGSSASYTIYFRTKWLYASDVPGTYVLPVVYTVTGQ